MKKLRQITTIFSLAVLNSLISPSKIFAAWGTGCVVDGDVATIGGIGCLVENILSNALRLIGLVAFIMVVVGAFRWLSSGGDSKALDGAKQTITMAIVGLLIAAGAWFIFQIIGSITGVDLTQFNTNLPINP